MEKVDPSRVERAARLYVSNKEAGQALGIAAGSFGRLCRQYGIQTPQARRRRRWQGQKPSPGDELNP
ncbi:MAG: hypothetical protein IT369_19375 [Candidatus Latescibacteria bacterium]|nr:hypothetical protein [Candidatus Latescibacterota bacterium]